MIAEFMPGGGRRKRATRKQIARVKRGGKIANAIKKQKEFHHKEYEVPQAEAELEKDLEGLQNSSSDSLEKKVKKKNSPYIPLKEGSKSSFLQKLLDIFLFWKKR